MHLLFQYFHGHEIDDVADRTHDYCAKYPAGLLEEISDELVCPLRGGDLPFQCSDAILEVLDLFRVFPAGKLLDDGGDTLHLSQQLAECLLACAQVCLVSLLEKTDGFVQCGIMVFDVVHLQGDLVEALQEKLGVKCESFLSFLHGLMSPSPTPPIKGGGFF